MQRSNGFTRGTLSRALGAVGAVSLAVLLVPSGALGDGGEKSEGGEQLCRGYEGFGLLGTITVPPNAATNPKDQFKAFDIGWVDAKSQRYYVADRTNAGVDVFDAEDDLFLWRIQGFAGAKLNPDGTANNDISGPDGLLVIHELGQLWAGDGDSTVKVVDLRTNQIVDVISTGGQKRADEMAYAPQDHILAVVNNADDPPFVTLISTKPHDRHVIGHIVLDKAHVGFDATGGAEQPAWDPGRHRFFLSIPEVNGNPDGAIAEIDPLAIKVTNLYPLEDGCNPAGLSLGPDHHLLVGCSAWTGPTTQSIVLDDTTGAIVAEVPVGGSDEVWFDHGDGHWYLAARNNTDAGVAKPVLGVVDAATNTLTTKVGTFTNSHSVSANPRNGHVFVPLAAGAPQCSTGCIGVYGRPICQRDDD